MAERLTEIGLFIDEPVYIIKKGKNSAAINKLAQLEDIMDKYGIEDLEQYVEEKRKQDKELRDNIQQLHTIINSTGYDRDTWKRACEFLAYKYAEEYFDGRDIEHCFNANKRDKFVKENINYFYQQAKKEGNDESNINRN